jgi:hypothetical protein
MSTETHSQCCRNGIESRNVTVGIHQKYPPRGNLTVDPVAFLIRHQLYGDIPPLQEPNSTRRENHQHMQ